MNIPVIYPAENALPDKYDIKYYVVDETGPGNPEAYYDAINNKYYLVVDDITTKRVGISLVNDFDERGREIGILSSTENNVGSDTNLTVMCVLTMGGVSKVSVCDFKIKEPTYAVSAGVSISGEKSLYKNNEYIMRAVLKDRFGNTPIGTEYVEWGISMSNIDTYLVSYSKADEYGIEYRIVTSSEEPSDEQISENITLTIDVTNGDGTTIPRKTFTCMLLNENVIMTSVSNPVMMSICNNAWPSVFHNPNAMTKAQAAMITEINDEFHDISQEVKFNEFKYFTGVTYLPDSCFENCNKMTEITLPTTITGMGVSVFSLCRKLNKISYGDNEYTIPNVDVIKSRAFFRCEELKKLRLPNTVTEIDEFAFGGSGFRKAMLSNCELEDGVLLLPQNITTIYGNAFETSTWSPANSNNNLIVFSIPSSLNLEIDERKNVLRGKYYKEYITEPGSISYISEDGVLYSSTDGISKDGLIKYPAAKNTEVTDVTSLDGIRQIYDYAFLFCTNIGTVEIPSTVLNYNLGAHCFERSTVRVVDASGAEGLKGIPDSCFRDCMLLTDVLLPNYERLERIGTCAFYNCTNLTGLTIYEGVNELGADGDVFYNCGIVSLTLPDTITTLPKNTINFCQNLEHLVFPKYVNVNETLGIYECMVRDCASLIDVVLPVFSYYESITYDLYDAENNLVGTYESYAIATSEMEANYPDGHIEVVYGNNVIVNETMSPNFLLGCRNLQRFIMREEDNETVACIYDNSVYNKTNNTLVKAPYGAESVSIMNGTTEIGDFAFRGCNSIRTVVLPETIRTLGDYSFMESSLEEINIPNSVTRIGGRGFLRCSNLEKMLVGSSVNRISYLAFDGCVNLGEITFLNKQAAALDCSAGSSNFHPFGNTSSSYAGNAHRQDGTNRIYIPYNSNGYDNTGDAQGNNKWVGDPITNAEMCGYSYEYMPYVSTFVVKIYDENGTLVTNNVYAKSQRGEFVSNGNDYRIGFYDNELGGNVFTSINNELYNGETIKFYSDSNCGEENLLGEIEITYGVTRYQIGNMRFGLRGSANETEEEYVTLTKSEYETIMSNLELLNKLVICK